VFWSAFNAPETRTVGVLTNSPSYTIFNRVSSRPRGLSETLSYNKNKTKQHFSSNILHSRAAVTIRWKRHQSLIYLLVVYFCYLLNNMHDIISCAWQPFVQCIL